MQAYANLDEAYETMIRKNRAAGRSGELTVMVEGPRDDEVTLMSLRQAVEADLTYEWAA